MATKKPIPKKAVAKPAAKKSVVKPVAKKVAIKSAPKKTVVAKKAAPKPVAKKATPKPLAKKANVKPAVKKSVVKPVVKPAVKKVATPKKAVPKVATKTASKVAKNKVEVKKVMKKDVVKASSSKPIAKPIVKLPAKKKELKAKPTKLAKAPKPEKAPKPVKAPKEPKPPKVPKPPKPPKPVKKPANTKTIIPPAYNLPKKSDVFKTNTFGTPTLKNESGKVIAHRKTSELKRRTIDTSIKKYEPEQTRSILDMNASPSTASFRYSDDDLAEFKEIIFQKLDVAKTELQYLQGVIMRKDEGGTEDTENKYQGIEDGSAAMDREQFTQLASRQITFISHLEQAMVRVENKTYGICRETGKLIDKARLRAVPHATLSIEAKNAKRN
jgi:RNA polymerase-binding transcription factor DksA